MARDLTLRTYLKLLRTYLDMGYSPIPLERYFSEGPPQGRTLLLRHDVDRSPDRSLKMAQVEAEAGVKGTYYFRTVPASFEPRIIRAIADLGHEIGYHYEDLARCKGNMDRAADSFLKGLEQMRRFYPVRTVCMHGSPLSSHNNLRLLERIDLAREGIIGEPYRDLPDAFFYLSDTGGHWSEKGSSVRDHSQGASYGIRTSFQLMEAIEEDRLPPQIQQTVHPQRWKDQLGPWLKEQGMQKIKNGIKKLLKLTR